MGWSAKDLKDKGLVFKGGKYVPIDRVTQRGKVSKLKPLVVNREYGFALPPEPVSDQVLALGYSMAVDPFKKEGEGVPNGTIFGKNDDVVEIYRQAQNVFDEQILTDLKNYAKYYGCKILSEFNKVEIKPLSVNQAWAGRRFKTPAYKAYTKALTLLLPDKIVVPDGLLYAYYEFGLSSLAGDWDNPCKPCQDIITKKYGFNDKRIRKATVTLVQVPKGQEYIKFKFESL